MFTQSRLTSAAERGVVRAALARTTAASGSGALMIEVRGLTKRYGDVLAVDDLTFAVRPGR